MRKIVSCFFIVLIFICFLCPCLNVFSSRVFFLRDRQTEVEKSRGPATNLSRAITLGSKSKKVLKKDNLVKRRVRKKKIEVLDYEENISSDESVTEEVSYENSNFSDYVGCSLKDFFDLFFKDKIENCEENFKKFVGTLFLADKLYTFDGKNVESITLGLENVKVNLNEALFLLKDFVK